MNDLRALSLTRPWTELVLAAGDGVLLKDCENRPRRTTYRGTVVIHGAKSWDDNAEWVAADLLRRRIVTPTDLVGRLVKTECPTGFLGTVEIVGCHLDGDLMCNIGPGAERCSPWAFPESWHYTLTNPRRFPETIPGLGALGFFRPPTEVIEAVAALAP